MPVRASTSCVTSTDIISISFAIADIYRIHIRYCLQIFQWQHIFFVYDIGAGNGLLHAYDTECALSDQQHQHKNNERQEMVGDLDITQKDGLIFFLKLIMQISPLLHL